MPSATYAASEAERLATEHALPLQLELPWPAPGVSLVSTAAPVAAGSVPPQGAADEAGPGHGRGRSACGQPPSRLAQTGDAGFWDFQARTGVLTWDSGMCSLYGLTGGAPPSAWAPWRALAHADDRARLDAGWRSALAGVQPLDLQFRAVLADGSLRHLRITARAKRDGHGHVVGLAGANWDVTPLHQLAGELAAQQQWLQVTLRSIGDAVITTNAQGQVEWLNPVAERMTGWRSAEACGRALPQVFPILQEHTRVQAESPVARCLAQVAGSGVDAGLAQHVLLVSRDGAEYGIENSAAPILGPEDALLGMVVVFHDVTEQRRLSGEMNWRATHDELTGLVNRSEFENRLRRVLNKAHEDASTHALLYIDLDQFKLINDACGHGVGDQLLREVSRLMAESVRHRDTLARLGGDEFAVILEHCAIDKAQRVAQQICDRMDDFRFSHDGRRFRIGASVGLVPVDSRWADTGAILQVADTSCYAAKEAGRNRVHTWYDTDLAMRARHGEMQWASRIEQALDDGLFVLYAQRIAALTGPVAGAHAEVLLRMGAADGALVLPGDFMPAAERFHLASRIDRWVLRCTLGWLLALPDPTRVDMLSVNLSGQSIGDRAFHSHAISTLHAAGPQVCRRLCFEITETAAITNLADATVFITQVRALGVRVALDDFGAGASSFGYLKSLPVDFLKIDGQFIQNLIDDPMDAAAVRCFAEVAQVMGVRTVAEFVDRTDVLARLRDMGIDCAQGFLLHRPAPIDGLLQPDPQFECTA